ncbi:uncharacterized protein IL334_007217 [Kwoniella shivajii]|uniref:Signal transduction-related protein n=1 Tax=Kwoniella shivajii TaxID=564305 RepID=A0ABZ1D829_9TREE|nr:hypothetical protein IL334_007217 [Kwoniella shivajii]
MKFGRYLAENQTPEWKRAYIDYRICKKKIKVVAKRLGQLKDIHGGPIQGQGVEAEDDDGDDSSGADDDHGPSAVPKDKSKSSDKGSLRSKVGSIAATPRLNRWTSRASERSQRSQQYGATGTSPRPPQSHSDRNVPPPLDLGEPGVDQDDTPQLSRSPAPTPQQVLDQDKSQSHLQPRSPSQDGERSNRPRKGVVFSPNLKADAIVETTIEEQSETDQSRQSSSDANRENDDDTRPLTRAGQEEADALKNDKKNSNSKGISIGRSPRLWTPRLNSGQGSFSGNSPKTGTGNASIPQTAETFKGGKSPGLGPRSLRSMTLPSPALPMRSPGPPIKTADNFEELYKQLEPDEQDFFDFLEHELDKVENFYLAREGEAMRRAHDLKDQLKELAEHRKIYHELYPAGIPEWEAKVGKLLPNAAAQVTAPGIAKLRHRLGFSNSNEESNGHGNNDDSGDVNNQKSSNLQVEENRQPGQRSNSPLMMNEHERTSLREAMKADKDHQTYNPERYQKYKKELRTAVLEFYRQLELIKNYRIMNLTGFRKALKKFEKTTKITCLEMYTDEKISKATFSQSEAIDGLIKQIEDLFTSHFEHGDSKKARDRLRRQMAEKTHYDSVFRSGIMLGIGLPAAVLALVESGKPHVRAELPAWGGLLQVYGGLYLPVMFAMLFQLNLSAFVAARINYEFVMELTRPTIDYRSFLEIPAFLFLTLSYCFYFSFAQVGSSNVAPTTWPAAWLVFVAVFFLNPLPILRRGTRYWLLRVLFRVCTPGYSRVEFIAFFLADELNSLAYSIQNIFFLSCGYSKNWPGDVLTVCHSAKTWPYALLACLPAGSRFVQCLKRYHDSKLNIHLINAGKYLSVILQQCLFIYWRSRGSLSNDRSFIVWIIVATASAAYTCTWDLVIDWSLFRPQSGLLRKDLGYSMRFVYYMAMVSNFLIRFVFLWYLPLSTQNVRLRSFIFALAEMLRRWQWNFFRVETEHLGNADAYRVTREIPLPYRRINNDSDEDHEADDSATGEKSKINSKRRFTLSIQLDKIRKKMADKKLEREQQGLEGRGPDALNAGPRGHKPQRDYEARRPGDLSGNDTPLGPNAV